MHRQLSLLALLTIACGGPSPEPAAPTPTTAEAIANAAEPPPPRVMTTEECIPTGMYKVDVDLTGAKYSVEGGTMSLEYCEAQLAAVVPGYFGQMAIRHHEGAVQVAWPALRQVRAEGCTVEIIEAKGETKFTFENEAAEGIAAFIMTVPNHNETCAATGASIRLTLTERH